MMGLSAFGLLGILLVLIFLILLARVSHCSYKSYCEAKEMKEAINRMEKNIVILSKIDIARAKAQKHQLNGGRWKASKLPKQ
jgi:hypothetical protein